MKKIRLLVLGTGSMAANHARSFANDPRAEVIAAADIDAKRAAVFASKHGISRAFGSLDDALAWNGFDATANVTSDAAHYATTLKLIAAGKHVFCEKPLAEDFAKASEMADRAEQAGLVNMVNLSYRNVPALQKARAMIAAGEIGEVRHVEASYRQSWLVGNQWGDWRTDPTWLWRLSTRHGSRGVLGDVGIHILDFATYAVGMMPARLQAQTKVFGKVEHDRIADYPLDANDSATMAVEFENGALGVIHASRFMTGYANTLKLDIFGTRGAIEINHGSAWTELRCCAGEDVHTQAWRQVAAESTPTNYQKFISAIVAGQNDEPSFRRGAALQQVLDLCLGRDASMSAQVNFPSAGSHDIQSTLT
jgi:predicted dehydrogenase